MNSLDIYKRSADLFEASFHLLHYILKLNFLQEIMYYHSHIYYLFYQYNY